MLAWPPSAFGRRADPHIGSCDMSRLTTVPLAAAVHGFRTGDRVQDNGARHLWAAAAPHSRAPRWPPPHALRDCLPYSSFFDGGCDGSRPWQRAPGSTAVLHPQNRTADLPGCLGPLSPQYLQMSSEETSESDKESCKHHMAQSTVPEQLSPASMSRNLSGATYSPTSPQIP